jgi:hypothetical protein
MLPDLFPLARPARSVHARLCPERRSAGPRYPQGRTARPSTGPHRARRSTSRPGGGSCAGRRTRSAGAAPRASSGVVGTAGAGRADLPSSPGTTRSISATTRRPAVAVSRDEEGSPARSRRRLPSTGHAATPAGRRRCRCEAHWVSSSTSGWLRAERASELRGGTTTRATSSSTSGRASAARR